MSDFARLYADEAHKKKVLLELLSERDAEIDRLQRELAEARRALDAATIDNEQYKQANDALTKEILLLRQWSSHFRAT